LVWLTIYTAVIVWCRIKDFCNYSLYSRSRVDCDSKRWKTGHFPNAFLTKHLAPGMDSCVFWIIIHSVEQMLNRIDMTHRYTL